MKGRHPVEGLYELNPKFQVSQVIGEQLYHHLKFKMGILRQPQLRIKLSA